ncbi:hypothetical protein Tdes44962_MAKER00505 [Teratosphaeria destructans]|uniref:Uncharacterized protein n=1 Tax=Teratosphaeria destructans TaxID=418781 RepID=A0A9W7SQ53_9PEZI|nr:hypothetical protein Tdes44962_MAKER00505 [Teratosphaeria destructans]
MNNLPPTCLTPAPSHRNMTDAERDQHVLDLLTEAQVTVKNKQKGSEQRAPLGVDSKNMDSQLDVNVGLTHASADLQERNGGSSGNVLVAKQKKRKKIVAWYLRWEEKREIKQLLKIVKVNIAALLKEAPALDAEVKRSHTKTQELTESAKANPRPSLPPARDGPDELFIRPADAPLSRYEELVNAHNEVVEQYAAIEAQVRKLKRRVVDFTNAVKEVDAANTGSGERLEKLKGAGKGGKSKQGRNFTKLDHDVEALDNAARNLDREVEEVEKDVRVARDVLKGASG